jgi:hypothetical protein
MAGSKYKGGIRAGHVGTEAHQEPYTRHTPMRQRDPACNRSRSGCLKWDMLCGMDDTVRTTVHHVTSHGTEHGAQHGTHRDVTVTEAVLALGLTPEAIRARLRRGTLSGYKADDDTWRVRLPDAVSPLTVTREDRQPPPEGARHTVTDDTSQVRDGTQRHVTDDALVTHLQEEVVYLRERLEDAMGQLAEERRRADVLQLTARTDASQEATEAPQSDESPLKGIRGWWHRIWGK